MPSDFPTASDLRKKLERAGPLKVVLDSEIAAISEQLQILATRRALNIKVPRRTGVSPFAWSSEIVTYLANRGYACEVRDDPKGVPLIVHVTW